MNTRLRNETAEMSATAGRGVQYSRSPFSLLPSHLVRARGFTLIELLIVIAIMAILAALVLTGTTIAAAAKKRSRAKGELNQIAHMVESYKIKLNVYPPSAGNVLATTIPYPALYYELEGTRLNGGLFTTLDGSASIAASSVNGIFGMGGFQNVSQGGGDEGSAAQNFTKGSLRPGQFMELKDGAGTTFIILGSSVEGPTMLSGTGGHTINPIGYNSANPTNNPKTYDLWLDILVRGKTERIYPSL